jgi:hypothetical protein
MMQDNKTLESLICFKSKAATTAAPTNWSDLLISGVYSCNSSVAAKHNQNVANLTNQQRLKVMLLIGVGDNTACVLTTHQSHHHHHYWTGEYDLFIYIYIR